MQYCAPPHWTERNIWLKLKLRKLTHIGTVKVDKSKAYDIRDYASYGVTEASRAIGMPQSTLRSWCTKNQNGEVLFHPASLGPPVTLSFNNLIEARVLRILRVTHGIRLQAIRDALEFAKAELSIDRPLLHKGLMVDGESLVLKRYGELVELNPSAQLKMLHMLEEHMQRIDWDSEEWAERFYPTFNGVKSSDRTVFIDPAVSFGNSLVSSKCITTNILYVRFNAGEAIEDLVADYDISREEIESAIVYEEAA